MRIEARQRPMRDVGAVAGAVELDLDDAAVGVVDGLADVRAERGDAEDAAAVRDDEARAARGAGVEDVIKIKGLDELTSFALDFLLN